MADLTIRVEGADVLADRLRELGKEAPLAVLRAIRRTRSTVMTRVARVVAHAAGLPVRRVRRSIHGTSPNLSDPTSTITLWGGRDALIRYSSSVQGRVMPPSAFRAKMPGGHRGIFERRPGTLSRRPYGGRAEAKRIRPGVWHTLPIDEAFGPPFTEFLQGGLLQEILAVGGEAFRENLEREINFRLSRRVA